MQDTSRKAISATSTVPPRAIPLAAFANMVEELLGRHLVARKDGSDTSLPDLVKVVLKLQETIEERSVQNRTLQSQLSGPRQDGSGDTTVSHAASQTPPEVATRPKHRRSGPPSPIVQHPKYARTISPHPM
ncbi:hypothetical protein FN846DRAFT_910516 [Sphaerosporella brunnea]|uniref:Uncharacterized protein n=1 Tax=Sphaerosporella brunnea TaxID=1250544 RepID=A0A5J5ELL4_9PEZI|nr:hypothetical protein FN846DRAFT_910516 [Sphaerosporella brunnea]